MLKLFFMDNQNTNQQLFGLKINENSKTQLRGAAVVAGIAAILSLISSVLKAVGAFMNKSQVEYQFEGFEQPSMSVQRTGNIAGAIITLIISILLFYFLNRFSTQTKNGINSSNQQLVNNGLGGLASYFVTIGVLLIIGLAFVLLAVVIGVTSSGT
jgi:hypothetical protein